MTVIPKMFLKISLTQGRHMQYVAVISANLLSFITGAAVCWSSPVLARLEDEDYSPFPRDITSAEAMWTGALISLGTALGPFPSAYLAEYLGRKRTLLLSAIPWIIGWLLTGTANSFIQLLIARLILGLASGVVFTVVPTYVSEIAEDEIRGGLGALLQVCMTAGMLFSYCIGPYVSYEIFAIICGAIPILFAVTFCWMPKSPYHLIAKDNIEDARASLRVLRSKTQAEIDEELKEIQANVNSDLKNRGTYRELLTSHSQRWPLFISIGLAISFPLSGVMAILVYAEPLLKKTASDLSADVLAIILGLFQLMACLTTPFIFDRIGRKVLLLISSICMAIPLSVFGTYFYVIENKLMDENALNFVPITCLVIYITASVIGFGGIMWVVLSEIFPVNLREKALALSSLICFFTAFITALTFDDLDYLMRSSGTFWLYSSFCALSGVFVALVLPETRGLSFQQIQQRLKRQPGDSAEKDP